MRKLVFTLTFLVATGLTAVTFGQDAGEAAAGAAGTAADAAVPSVVESAKEAVGQAKDVWAQIRGGERIREGIAGAIVLLIFLWRRFAAKLVIGKLSTYQVGLIVALLGFGTSAAAELAAPTFTWPGFISNGLIMSSEAMLFWKTVGQKVLPKLFGTGKADAESEPAK